jgi:hypothetical protein
VGPVSGAPTDPDPVTPGKRSCMAPSSIEPAVGDIHQEHLGFVEQGERNGPDGGADQSIHLTQERFWLLIRGFGKNAVKTVRVTLPGGSLRRRALDHRFDLRFAR